MKLYPNYDNFKQTLHKVAKVVQFKYFYSDLRASSNQPFPFSKKKSELKAFKILKMTKYWLIYEALPYCHCGYISNDGPT